ncbi:hypothetical protein ACLHDD_02300 [Pantoea sp. NSTU24]|uniref:hypothetical protein n=1 Tax=Pantoea sp. NSTU24 TaxID=3391144 RepID=UPI003D05E918
MSYQLDREVNMKRIFIMAISFAISACATPVTKEVKKPSQYELDRARTAKIEKSMQEIRRKANDEYTAKAESSGCNAHALEASKKFFEMALKYYGTNPESVTEKPEDWANIAAQSCVSGYEAGLSGQPQSLLDNNLFEIRYNFTNPFQYKAVAESMYWGYERARR